MAFPLPDHLPRRQDVSSAILTKIGNATNNTLNASEASSWLTDLDNTILATKRQIHERITSSLPEFERQLNSALSVQERLVSLKRNVGELDTTVMAPEAGLVDTILRRLTAHSALSQDKIDIETRHSALHQISILRRHLNNLADLVSDGQLPQATKSIYELEDSFRGLPRHVAGSNVIQDLQRRFSTIRARTEDQLDDAYLRIIQINSSEVLVKQKVPVRQSHIGLTIPDIISSLPATSLTQNLGILRRDLLATVDYLIMQPLLVDSSESPENEYKLSLVSNEAASNDPFGRLANLTTFLDFLKAHLFHHLPAAWLVTLNKPISSSVLYKLLIPSLPSTFTELPTYLLLTEQVVAFEDRYLIQLLGNDAADTPLKDWISGVSGHYERQRRTEILGRAREMFTTIKPTTSFTADLIIRPPEPLTSNVIPIQEDDASIDSIEDDAWGLNDETSDKSPVQEGSDDTEAWGLDDDLEEASTDAFSSDANHTLENSSQDEPDPNEAWGWGDEEDIDVSQDDDDPWAESEAQESEAPSPTRISAPAPVPKVAKGLAKLAMKNKKAESDTSSALSSPVSKRPSSPLKVQNPAPDIKVRPPQLASTKPQPIFETYRVSGRMKELIATVQNILNDAQQLASEGVKLFPGTSVLPGKTLYQTASSVLDIYRVIYPGQAVTELRTPTEGFQYSNDLFWLAGQVEIMDASRFTDEARRLKLVGERWFDETINRERIVIQSLISEQSKGFIDTGSQEQFDECEAAVTSAVQRIKRYASQWKGILPKGRYYTALGLVVDAALSLVLGDILDLPDIPELESGRLGELCRIFNSLEGLFSEETQQSSFVGSYVPLWLKFTYLSELLEASMADITYLFEEGMLVDFDVDELVKLVKALFADNPLRTTTINKIMAGHPGS